MADHAGTRTLEELAELVFSGSPEAAGALAVHLASHPFDARAIYLRGRLLWRDGRLAYPALVSQLEECRRFGDTRQLDLVEALVELEAGNSRAAAALLDRLEASGVASSAVEKLRYYLVDPPSVPAASSVPALHGAPVVGLACSDDGQVALSGSRDGTLAFWTDRSGEQLGAAPWRSLALSANGRWAAAGCEDGSLRLWDLREPGGPRVLVTHPAPLVAVAFSPGGELLACGGEDGGVQVVEVPHGTLRVRLHQAARSSPPHGIRGLGFSGEGELLVTGVSGMLKRWSWSEKRVVWQWDEGGHRALAGAPFHSSRLVGLRETEGFVHIQDLANRRTLLTLPLECAESLVVTGDPALFVGLDSAGRIRRFRPSGQSLFAPQQPWRVTSLAAARTQSTLLLGTETGAVARVEWPSPLLAPRIDLSTGSPEPARPSVPAAWPDAPRGRLRAGWRQATVVRKLNGLSEIALSPDGDHAIARFTLPDQLEIWDTRTGKPKQEAPDSLPERGWSPILSTDGGVLLSSSRTGEVELRRPLATPSPRKLTWPAPVGRLQSVTDDGRLALEYLDGMRLREVASGRVLWKVPEPAGFDIRTTRLSADGRLLIAGYLTEESAGDVVYATATQTIAWDVETQERLWSIEQQTGVLSLSAGGRLLALGHPHDQLLDAATGRVVRALPEGTQFVSFSGDELAFCLLGEGDLAIIELATGRETRLPCRSTGRFLAVARGGSTFCVSGPQDLLEFWHLDFETAADSACAGAQLRTSSPRCSARSVD